MLKLKSHRYMFLMIPALVIMVSDGSALAEESGKTAAGQRSIESAQNYDNFLYDPTNRTDPFRSFITATEEISEKEREKPRTYLETLELSQLNLTAIVISDKGRWAMVRDSKDLGHVVREGTPIGTRGGVVYRIKEGELIIREEYRDFRGTVQHREVSKKTPSQQ